MRIAAVRAAVTALLAAALWAAAAGEAAGQGLPLKQPVASAERPECPPPVQLPEAGSGDPGEAAALTREASGASVAGDHEAAREALAEAAELAPSDAQVSYLLGRTHEDLDDPAGALGAYCRSLGLDPDDDLASELESSIARLDREHDVGVGDGLEEAFGRGIDRFEAGDAEAAHQAFDEAVAEAPEWPPARYNRGVAALGRGDAEAARGDLAAYLEMAPDAEDRELVEVALGFLEEGDPEDAWVGDEAGVAPQTGPSARTTFLAGLVPGGGHFYTGRPLMGGVVAAAAASLVIYGVTYERVQVECRHRPPGQAECPDDEIIGRSSERPHQELAVGGAVAVTLLGALEAVWRVRRDRGPDEGLLEEAAYRALDRLPGQAGARLQERVTVPLSARPGAASLGAGGGPGVAWLGVRF